MWWLVELEQGSLRRRVKLYGLFVHLNAKKEKKKKQYSRCRPCYNGPYLGKKYVTFTKEKLTTHFQLQLSC